LGWRPIALIILLTLSCTIQGLKTYSKMKKLIKKSTPSNASSFAFFSKTKLAKAQQKNVKGGDDSAIIVEDVVEG